MSILHPLLKGDRAFDGIDHTGELGEQPVSRRLDHSPPVLRDAGLDQLAEVGGERCESAFFVLAHQPRVTSNIGSEDGGEAALDGHGALLRQAGFAEAILDRLHIIAITAHEIAFNHTQRELRV